jgi:putative ABC transport system permease protein
VIGMVRDIRARGLERTSEPQVYLSSKQDPDNGLTYYAPKDLVIYSTQQPETLLPVIRQIIYKADPEQPISDTKTMEDVIAGETESRTIQMRVLIVFTGVAILLAGLGIYGVLAFTVSMRQQEFGIRMALGAAQGDIFTTVLKQGAYLAVIGLLPGLALAYLAARLLESLLAGVQPADAHLLGCGCLKSRHHVVGHPCPGAASAQVRPECSDARGVASYRHEPGRITPFRLATGHG